jgi:two-component system, sporulation sensor kinase E
MDRPQKSRTIIAISLLSIIAGAIVMIGWIFNIPALQSIIPGFVSMKFNAALCFILFGSALLTQYQIRKYNTPLFIIVSLLGTLIALLTISQDIFHFNTGIDQLFITDKTAQSPTFPFQGRMAFNSSVNFLLLGLGLLTLTTKNRLLYVVSQYLFHAVTILSAVALIGYLYGVSLFHTLLYVTSMATHTAILFFILSLAASLLNPSIGITRLFTGKQVGNQMAKRLFTLMILMVIIFGSLRVQTQRFLLFSSLDIGISLLAVCFLLISLLIIWNTASWLNKIDAKRFEAEAEVKLINAELEKMVEERSAEFRQSEEKYHSLIEQASDAIYILDFNGNFSDVNASMCKMIGYTKEELLQLNVETIIDPEELKTDPLPKGVNNAGQSIIRERRFMRKDGLVFTVEINVKIFSNNRVMIIARDITGRKKMETELKEAELKFRTIADKSIVGVYIVQNGKFVYVNPRFALVFGYEPDELTNTVPLETIIHEDYRAATTEHVRRRIAGEVESVHYETMGRKKDGTANWVEFYGSRTIMGGIPTIIGSMIDITERKKAEELILKEKALSDSIINSLPGIFYLYNEQRQFFRWNKNFETVYGYTKEEIEKINTNDLIAEEDRDLVRQAVDKVFAEGYAMIEAKAITKNGVRIPFLFTGTLIMYENQRCLLGTGIDISMRIKAEEELRSSEQKYKLLFESNPLPMWMIAKDDMSVIAVNDAAAAHYGYTKDELLNVSTKVLRPPEDFEQQLEGYQQNMGHSTQRNIVRHIKKDGSIIFVHLISHDIIFEGRAVRLSLTNDVTEKLKAEESLKKSEANLQAILKTTDTAYALFDTDLKVLAFNQKAAEFVKEKYNHMPAKGDKLADYFPSDKFPEFNKFAREVLNGKNINYEVDYQQADGSVLWYYERLFPIINDNKEIIGMLMALYDITERKNAEQDLQSAYSRIQNHIDSIKDMAWKQSHLIRSPLANLKGLAALLKNDTPDDEQVLMHIQNELDRMDTIIIEMAREASDHEINN